GGDTTNAEVTLGMVSPLLRRYLAPSDPLADYPDSLDDPALNTQALRGYLTGSLDAVLRIRREAREPSYLVVDYKTNWLGGFDGEVLKNGDYPPAPMAAAMMSAHYPLQALLYAVAVHRMLRWRQPNYDPAVHLGGILYLFVRGMAGPGTPRGRAVWGVLLAPTSPAGDRTLRLAGWSAVISVQSKRRPSVVDRALVVQAAS